MPQFELEDAGPSNGSRNGTAVASPRPTLAPNPASVSTERAKLAAWSSELDTYYAGMNTFEGMEPDEVMQRIGGMYARLTEIRAMLQRLGTQRALHLRTREVEPMQESLKLLFQIHSRLLSSRQMELDMTRGGP